MSGDVLVLDDTRGLGAAVLGELLALGAPARPAWDASPGAGNGSALDLDAPGTWPPALTGVSRLFLPRMPVDLDVESGLAPFLRHAVSAGVRHVVYCSTAGVRAGMPDRRIEQAVDDCGLPRVFLRPAVFYQELFGRYRADISQHGRLRMPIGRGRLAMVDARDVATAAARLLVDPFPEATAAHTLTGPDSLTGAEMAEELSLQLGRALVFEPVSFSQYRRELVATGQPLSQVYAQLLLNASSRLALSGRSDPDLRRLLGRPPYSFADFVRDHREHWRR